MEGSHITEKKKVYSFCRTNNPTTDLIPAQMHRGDEAERRDGMLTLTTEKETSQGWNAAGSRCDVAVSAASLSNSSSQATAAGAEAAAAPSSRSAGAAAATAGSASFRVWFLGGRWERRSEVSGDILGPFQLTSTNTFASASGEPSGERGAGGGGRPSARRTTRRTRKFRAGGGRGHRIILATITGQRALLLRPPAKKPMPSGEKSLPATTLPTTSDRKSKLPQKDRAPRPNCHTKIPSSAPRAPRETRSPRPNRPAQWSTNWGEEDGARLDFGGGIGIRGADLCRGVSGFEEGVGDWDWNIRGEMHARPERAMRRESEERREEINRGRRKSFFTGSLINFIISFVIFWGGRYRRGGSTHRPASLMSFQCRFFTFSFILFYFCSF